MSLIRELLKRDSSDPAIMLLTVDHPDFSAPVRLCTNTVGDDIVSGGDTYTAAPFHITWPSDDTETPVAQLEAVNVGRAIALALMAISSPASAVIQVVLLSDPDTVEAEAPGFLIRNARWNALTLTADITRERIVTEPCPKYRISPQYFAALFR